MSVFPEHYTIQRMSVIVVGTILVLGIVAMLSGYEPSPINPIAIQVNPSSNGTLPNVPKTTYQPSFNVTKVDTSFNFIGALSGLNATSLYSFNSTKLFNFEYGYNPLALAIANLLSLPANRITPWTYGAIYNVLDANYTKWTSNKTVTLYYYPMNVLGKTIYLNFTYQTDPQFVNAYYQLNRSYPFPPSDEVIVGSPTYSIINSYTVNTWVYVTYSYYTFTSYSVNIPLPWGSISITEESEDVYGLASLFVNGQLVSTQYFDFIIDPWGGTYHYTLYDDVNVPPGVIKQVYGSFTFTSHPIYSSSYAIVGNKTYITINVRPSYPDLSINDYTFNWYEYNVSVPIEIIVYNGTNPITYVDNQVYHSRIIYITIWYTTWSSLPQSYTTSITTQDHITFMKYNLTRTWDAGTITIKPISYTQIVNSATFMNYRLTSPWYTRNPWYTWIIWFNTPSNTNNEIVNYYLSFSTTQQINEPPSYIFDPIPPLNKTTVLQWSYFLNNYSVVQGLYNATHGNIDQFNFVLPQLVTSLYNDNLTEHTIALASFIEPWNVSKVKLNVTNVLANSTMLFLPVEIIPNTTYSILYSALGAPNASPNVTVLTYNPKIFAGNDYYASLQSGLYNGALPPAYYSPFTNKIYLNYGIYWPYGLPYAQFSVESLEKTYYYWYNPNYPGWFPIS